MPLRKITERGGNMTDKEYRELSEKSEKLAQNKLYEEYINYVYKIVYNKLRSCASNEDIEECVSDVFLAVFLNYHNNEGTDGDLKGYIGTIASRKAINKYHSLMAKSGRTVSSEEYFADIADSKRIEEEAEKEELRDIMLRAINSLGEPDTTIVFQKFYFNRSSKEIAQKLSMTAGAVRVRCKRALERLEKLLSKEGITLKEGF